ncbi:hypothetical protein N8333_02570 [Flavobacteriaceae bacterium]|nr:hypothetical protein [Flavobacteriaceae bacterium]
MNIELILLAVICLVVLIDLVKRKAKVNSTEIVDASNINLPKSKKNFWFAILLLSFLSGLIIMFWLEYYTYYIYPIEFIQLVLDGSLSLIDGDLSYSIRNFMGGFFFFLSCSLISVFKKKIIKIIKPLIKYLIARKKKLIFTIVIDLFMKVGLHYVLYPIKTEKFAGVARMSGRRSRRRSRNNNEDGLYNTYEDVTSGLGEHIVNSESGELVIFTELPILFIPATLICILGAWLLSENKL